MSGFIADASSDTVRVRSPQAGELAERLQSVGAQVARVADGVIDVQDRTSEQIGTLAAQYHLTLFELTTKAASLEEAYMALTEDALDYRSSRTVAGTERAAA